MNLIEEGILDIQANIDDAPVILKRPILPHTYNTFKIPLTVVYEKTDSIFPDTSYYRIENITVMIFILAGNRYTYSSGALAIGQYTLEVDYNVTWLIFRPPLESLIYFESVDYVVGGNRTYSMMGVRDPDGDPNPPMILSFPKITNKADALKYSRITFPTQEVVFRYTNQSIQLYGGFCRLSVLLKGIPIIESGNGIDPHVSLGKYIIDDVTIGRGTSTYKLLDMRSKLTVKYPTEVYTKDAYPFLEDDYDQTLVGYCFGYMCGIPATPTNGKQIYDSSNAKIQWTDYHIPPNWKSITKIEILMEDTWVEVYPGLGNPYDITYTTRNPQPVKMFPETGLFQVYSSQARGLNSNGSVINYANSPQKCRVFCEYDKGTVRESIKFLLDLANTPELSDNFDGEFDGLYYSNLYLNQSKSIFEWIETIQSGNIIGGQLLLQQDRIFFKLENPNRPRLLDIGKHEALNHEDLSVSIAKDFFYSGYDISYKKAYIGDNQDGHFSGVFGRNPQPDVYTGTDNTVRLVYRSPTDQGYDTTYIQKRISILRDLATAQRHKVSGLRVPLTQKYMDIELYDVIGYIPFILEGTALPMMEWTVYGKTVLMGSEGNCIQLDLIERVTTTAWDGTPLTN